MIQQPPRPQLLLPLHQAALQCLLGLFGAVLVIAGFIFLISCTVAEDLEAGFCLSFYYTPSTLLLFVLAHHLTRVGEQQQQQHDEHDDARSDEAELRQQLLPGIEEAGTVSMNAQVETSVVDDAIKKVPVLISLLYGLAVLSLGVTGAMATVNMFPYCSGDSTDQWRPQWAWTITNTSSSIPKQLQARAHRPIAYRSTASFGFVVDTETTLFSGNSQEKSYDPCLWSASANGGAPVKHGDHTYPRSFISVSNSTVCFESLHGIISSVQLSPSSHSAKEFTIFCTSDGWNFRPVVAEHDPSASHNKPEDLVVLDEILWFKRMPGNYNESGYLVYSLNPDTMIVSLHSQRVSAKKSDDDRGCRRPEQIRKQAVLSLFIMALPVTVTSIGIWVKKRIPSMCATTYIGLTLVFACIYAASDPWSFPDQQELAFKWWLSVSGFIWLLGLTFFIFGDVAAASIVNKKNSVQWGLVVGGFAFFFGMRTLLLKNVMNDDSTELWHWILLNLLTFVPLILLGAATDTTLLVILGAVGFIVDSLRLSTYVGDHMGQRVSVPLQFLVFSFGGLLVGAAGKLLGNNQHHVKIWAERMVRTVVGCLSREDESRQYIHK